MVKLILVDEFHLGVFAPRGLTEEEYEAMRQTLNHKRFRARLRRAAAAVVNKYPPLAKVKLKLSR